MVVRVNIQFHLPFTRIFISVSGVDISIEDQRSKLNIGLIPSEFVQSPMQLAFIDTGSTHKTKINSIKNAI